MENTKYIGENQLRQITDICEHLFTKDAKNTLKRLQDKYKIEFTTNKQTNVNLLWRAYSDELLLIDWRSVVTHQTYKELYNQTNGINILAGDMLKIYIEHNHQEDYNFIWKFNPELMIEEINMSLRFAAHAGGFFYWSDSLSELLNCNDYYAFFSQKFGIANVNAKAIKATKNALKAFDSLLEGIPNKAIFFQALSNYYQNNDLAELHNTIHTTY
jgi:hypothetical protein